MKIIQTPPNSQKVCSFRPKFSTLKALSNSVKSSICLCVQRALMALQQLGTNQATESLALKDIHVLPTLEERLEKHESGKFMQTRFNYPWVSQLLLLQTGLAKVTVALKNLAPGCDMQQMYALFGALGGFLGISKSIDACMDLRSARLLNDMQGLKYATLELIEGILEVLSSITSTILASENIALIQHEAYTALDKTKQALEIAVLCVAAPLSVIAATISTIKLRDITQFLQGLTRGNTWNERMAFLVDRVTLNTQERTKALATAQRNKELETDPIPLSAGDKELLMPQDLDFLASQPKEVQPYLEYELVKMHHAKNAALERLIPKEAISIARENAKLSPELWGQYASEVAINAAIASLKDKRNVHTAFITAAALTLTSTLFVSLLSGPSGLIVSGLAILLLAEILTVSGDSKLLYDALLSNPELQKSDKKIVALGTLLTVLTAVVSLSIFTLTPLTMSFILVSGGIVLGMTVGTIAYARKQAPIEKARIEEEYALARELDELLYSNDAIAAIDRPSEETAVSETESVDSIEGHLGSDSKFSSLRYLARVIQSSWKRLF